jgi:hypothetical protein
MIKTVFGTLSYSTLRFASLRFATILDATLLRPLKPLKPLKRRENAPLVESLVLNSSAEAALTTSKRLEKFAAVFGSEKYAIFGRFGCF